MGKSFGGPSPGYKLARAACSLGPRQDQTELAVGVEVLRNRPEVAELHTVPVVRRPMKYMSVLLPHYFQQSACSPCNLKDNEEGQKSKCAWGNQHKVGKMAVGRKGLHIAVEVAVHRAVVVGPTGLAVVVVVHKVVEWEAAHIDLVAVLDMGIEDVVTVDTEKTSGQVAVVRACYTPTVPEDTVMMFRTQLDLRVERKVTAVVLGNQVAKG